MIQRYRYTTVDTIFAKLGRDLRGTDLHESDVIEWIGEALGFMEIAELKQESVAFLEVKNYRAELPTGFFNVIQVAKYNGYDYKSLCPESIVNEIESVEAEIVEEENCTDCGIVLTDCQGKLLVNEDNVAYFRPNFRFDYGYGNLISNSYYRSNFSPVRLSNHSFFNSVVCRESDPHLRSLYNASQHEYTIVGGYPDVELRFNFKDGFVALAYLGAMIEPETGYPLIPDDTVVITAITYYIKWKLAERFRWNHREGFVREADKAEASWLKYVRQAINKSKMPRGIDMMQNMMEETQYLIPRYNKFSNFFGNLGREEGRIFK